MNRRPARLLLLAGLIALVALIVGRLAADWYTELLWFDQLGYAGSWWRRIGAGAALRLFTSAAGAAAVLLSLSRVVRYLGPVQLRRRYGNIEIAERIPRLYIRIGLVVVSILAGWWLSALSFRAGSGTQLLAWLNRGTWGVADPVFGRDLAFYIFTLPVLQQSLAFLLLIVVWSTLLVAVGYALVGAIRLQQSRLAIDPLPRTHLATLGAVLLVLLAARFWLARFEMLTHGSGFGGVVGFTDVNARLLAHGVMAVACLVAAAVVGWSASRGRWSAALVALPALVLIGLGVGVGYPNLIQRLRVVPNELARESPYLAENLEFTRMAFGVAGMGREPLVVRDDASSSRVLQPWTVRQPLWDEGPLQTAYNQMQALRGYYQFPSVHFDRYGVSGEEMPAAISVREFTPGGLPPDARTWRTLHLDVDRVRGNGAVVSPIATKTQEGNPVFWLRGVDPVQRAPDAPPDVELVDPTVLFGETTTDWIVVSDSTRIAAGAGGIRVGSFFRLFAFALRLGDQNMLFSGELTHDSRILLRRRVRDRVAALVPFLAWSTSPHPVLADGRIVWVLDGFSIATNFPLARPFVLDGFGATRYIRNSVKATVDALTGQVHFYVLDAAEPILAAWSRAFPELFASFDAMPDAVRRHLVYPRPLLNLQANVLEEYHVKEPAAFFSGVNAWQIPIEPGPTGAGREYMPLYVLGRASDSDHASFQLVVPFIARERQNMTAILSVENDPGAYGRLTLRELPPEAQVTGPRQVRTLIEQDPSISSQLTLWRQGGSDVELGRLRVLPMDGWILYVQPVFLLGSGGSIPQLQRVVASDGTIVAMGQTLSEATSGLVRGTPPAPAPGTPPPATPDATRRAWDLFQNAEKALRAGDWSEFGRLWQEMGTLLERAAQAGPGR